MLAGTGPLPGGRAGANNPRECDERQVEPGGGDSGPGQWTGECGAPGGDRGSGRASRRGLPFGGRPLPASRVRADGARSDAELSRPGSQSGTQGRQPRRSDRNDPRAALDPHPLRQYGAASERPDRGGRPPLRIAAAGRGSDHPQSRDQPAAGGQRPVDPGRHRQVRAVHPQRRPKHPQWQQYRLRRGVQRAARCRRVSSNT